MDFQLKNRVAAVAAGSAGLGFGSAYNLAQEGCRVAICGRRPEKLAEAAEQIRSETGAEVETFEVDLSQPGAPRNFVKSVVDHFGQLDILVANAGGPPSGKFEDMTDDQWEAAVQLNLLATGRMFHEALPHIRKSDHGRLVAITSLSAKQPIANLVLSNATRAGVHGLVKTLSRELAETGITVNAVCPGVIRTDRITQLAEQAAEREGITVEEAYAARSASIPMGRLGDPMEFGAAVAFLCSKQAAYITGSAIAVDGGMLAGLP